MIPAEAVEAAVSTLAEFTPQDEADSFDLKANDVWRGKVERILEAAAPYMLAASAAKLRGWYDERMSEESAPDVTLTDYEHGREVGTTEGILAAALLIEAETK